MPSLIVTRGRPRRRADTAIPASHDATQPCLRRSVMVADELLGDARQPLEERTGGSARGAHRALGVALPQTSPYRTSVVDADGLL